MFYFKVDTNVKVVNKFSALFILSENLYTNVKLTISLRQYPVYKNYKKKSFFTLWSRIVDIKACPIILNYI